jgi:hypothetical protein
MEKKDGIWQLDPKREMDDLYLTLNIMETIPAQEMLENINYANTVMPFIDSTAYRAGGKNLQWQEELLEDVRRLQSTWKRIKEAAPED